jgi:DNA-binding NtrC family response regulator
MDLSHRALIVDDEQDILKLLERVLAKMEIPCFSAASLSEAKQRLAKDAPRISFCITDMRLPWQRHRTCQKNLNGVSGHPCGHDYGLRQY